MHDHMTPRGSASRGDGIWAMEGMSMRQIKNCWTTDKGVLGKSLLTATLIRLSFFPTPYLPSIQLTFFQTPYLPFLLLIKMSARDEILRRFLKAQSLLPSQVTHIWIKRPQRPNPRLYVLVLVVTGSTEANSSSVSSTVISLCCMCSRVNCLDVSI